MRVMRIRTSTAASVRRRRALRKKGTGAAPVRRNRAELTVEERSHTLQLLVCGGVFVLLVAAKLLVPGRMAAWGEKLTEVMEKNIDVRSVFFAVGDLFTREQTLTETASEVYEAVFHPQEKETLKTAARVTLPEQWDTLALEELHTERRSEPPSPPADPETSEALEEHTEEPEPAGEPEPAPSVLYSEENLPDNVSMEQEILDFAYCTPVKGKLTSDFGYRDHPLKKGERFHYGVDIAAAAGTAICCFADGVVTAVGESSSYGKYCIVAHEGGYTTLYAHCSKVIAVSGAEVARDEKIAEVGKTGAATGAHLHFELSRGSVYLNPIYYVTP